MEYNSNNNRNRPDRSIGRLMTITLFLAAVAFAPAGCGGEEGGAQELADDLVGTEESASAESSGRGDGGPGVLKASGAADDIAEKGPYASRPFDRNIAVTPYVPAQEAVSSVADVALQVDRVTGETSELIVTLNSNVSRLQRLLRRSDWSVQSAAEEAFIKAVLRKDREISLAYGGPLHARRLVGEERMSDADRARGDSLHSPRAHIEKYIVIRYGSVALARTAQDVLSREPSVATVINNKLAMISWTPSDPYFLSGGVSPAAYYQWGMQVMNFPLAWDIVRGAAYIGILEPGYPGAVSGTTLTVHPDLVTNYRKQFSPGGPYVAGSPFGSINDHAVHVSGIVAAQANNAGVAGGCPNCSIANFTYLNNTVIAPNTSGDGATIKSEVASAYLKAVESGMQVLNWSGSNADNYTCPSYNSPDPMCSVLFFAAERSVLVVESAGNFNKNFSSLLSPLDLASQFSILPVGGVEVSGARWVYDASIGSNDATTGGVMGPAKSIVSTINANSHYSAGAYMCGDAVGYDESGARYSNGYGDGFGTCTGTSMAAPHVSALAGLVLSVNPRLNADQLRQIIRQNGSLADQVTPQLGYGLPDALDAVDAALATNPTRLTPLFSFYSSARRDSFYTTVPQMANAALDGSLRPRIWLGANAYNDSHGTYESAYGTGLGAYWTFPRSPFVIGPSGNKTPLAQVWVFTTHSNPKNAAVELEPLYRLSWKCGDPTPYPPAVCSTYPAHIDVAYANKSELGYFQWLGYRVDGIEGYVYPKTQSQPPGTVRLMRKYNATRDDIAIFPESAAATMSSQGYTVVMNGSDWLGYVYPNTNGSVPVVQ